MRTHRKDGYRVEDGKIVIELLLKEPKQLFDSRDPAPFLEKDLDDDAVDYIVSAIQEFPHQTKMKLHFFFSNRDQSLSDAELCTAIRHYFKYMTELSIKKVTRTIKNAQFFLICGSMLLIVCLTIAQLLTSFNDNRMVHILQSGLEIAGWVALWKPLELLFFDWWPIHDRRKTMEKIVTMEIAITDKANNFTTTFQ